MDVTFETQRGKPFSIEVVFFDTVLEIKEKVQKYQGIPIPNQTLVFNGQVLQDERDVEYCEILQDSRIQLLVASDSDTNNNKQQPQANEQQCSSPLKKKIQLHVNTPSSKTSLHLEMDSNDTVLKEKIHDQMEPFLVNRLVVQPTGAELQANRSVGDCEPTENNDVDANIKPSPTSSGTGSAGAAAAGSKKLKLLVLPKMGTKKIPVEMNATDTVGELRKELQKLHQRLHFHLPQDGYFFIYKQNVMDDDRSFRWHQVAQGDTIEIFNGSVTGGS
ncbi:cysteine-rich PDZ-binding protein-like [Hibiscus syriacus]|uniref:Cysteine-rich PDZ-binding protein-like n=1 Tax=Hibiscus syriacus TaxID=106335 RepID=A0A6A3CHB6_HIBSY|nr:ubiquitin domain-containing protein 7SL RNA1-like [Hibiscus syriacus]KAE8728670.1 cysteine-rich PDZ-binding protein-like [Hibiscus syriacus]